LTASRSGLEYNDDLTAMQETYKAPSADLADDEIIQSASTNTLSVKNVNETLTYLQFLNTAEEFDPNAERSSMVRRDVERVPPCYRLLYQERKHIVVFPLKKLLRNLMRQYQN
jgi:hypothetical protein